MNRQTNIVIIGGTACGPKAAARARRRDPHARITLVEQGENLSTATCGLTYYISGIVPEDKLEVQKPDYFRQVMDIDARTGTRATAINSSKHTVNVLDLKTDRPSTLEYDKLVLATGSVPVRPRLDRVDLKGIFTLTRTEDAKAVRELVLTRNIKQAVIVGAGLIGIEMAEALASMGLKVTVLEALDWVLPKLLAHDMAAHVENHLRSKGVDILTGSPVKGFSGGSDGWVRKVGTENAELEAGLVILALGVRPNVQLAREAGLSIGALGGITVNEFLQTSEPDIYSGGDCIENIDRITRTSVLVPLGSTANKHGRIIGTNVTGGHDTFPGVVGTSIVKVFDYNVARVGLTEDEARQAGFEPITSLVPGNDHAGYYPDPQRIIVKLVADRPARRILGSQIIGPGEVSKRIDVLATAITFGATIDDLANLDLAYAPPYNSAMDPLHSAANVIRNKIDGIATSVSARDVMHRASQKDEFDLIDVRASDEWQKSRIEVPQCRLLPLPELRSKIDSLNRESEIVVTCRTGIRAYNAQRILNGAGFPNVSFLEGCLEAWPYSKSGDEEDGSANDKEDGKANRQ